MNRKMNFSVRGLTLIFLCLSTLLFLGSTVKQAYGDLPSSNTDMVGLVPYYVQSGDTCGLYSMMQVLRWFDQWVSVNDLAFYLQKEEGPHYLWELDDALSHFMPANSWHTYGGFVYEELAKNWVKECICSGIPVICCIAAPGSTTLGWANHYVTIVGYDDAVGAWCLHDTGGFWEEVYGRGYDVWCYYDEFDEYWNVYWAATPDPLLKRGVVAVNLPDDNDEFAQPEVSITTQYSTTLEDAFDDQTVYLSVELTNVGTDWSFSQGTDGVILEFSNAEITWLNVGGFTGYHSLDNEGSGGSGFMGEIQPTTKLQLEYDLGLPPGATSSIKGWIKIEPLSLGQIHINYEGRLTDWDCLVRTRSFPLNDDSERDIVGYSPIDGSPYYGVITLLHERFCVIQPGHDSFFMWDDDTRPPQFSNPTITPFPVYDSSYDPIVFTVDIVDSDSGVSEYGFTYRWWSEDWTTIPATVVDAFPGGLKAGATIPRSEWINHFGEGLQYEWYAVDGDDDRPDDSERGYLFLIGPVVLDDDDDPPSLYDPTTSGDILESYDGDYLLQISASDYSGNCSVSFAYQFGDGSWSDYKSCEGPDVPFVYRYYIPRSEWINHVNEEIRWKVYAEDVDDDRPNDYLGVYSPVYDAGSIINVNDPPELQTIGNKETEEKTLLTFTAHATGKDVPANELTFSLGEGAPAGASIDPVSGVFTWTPTETQGPGTYPITVTVNDGSEEDSETITVTVNEVSETKDAQNIIDIVANSVQLPTSAFEGTKTKVKENRRNSMLHQLDAVLVDIKNAEALTDSAAKNAEYLSAIDHLNSLLYKTDGFAERGAADPKGSDYALDWIVTAEGQALVDPQIRELIATLTTRLVTQAP